MRIQRFEQGESGLLRAIPESLEDLWLLSRLVEKGDRLEGTAFRRVKALDLNRPDSGEKKLVRVLVEVESAQFAEAANRLRVTGKILSSSPSDYAPTGAFQTIDVEIGTKFTLHKRFEFVHRSLIDDAKRKAKAPTALIVAIDDRSALVCVLRQSGVKFLFEIDNHASKRDPKSFADKNNDFLAETLDAVQKRATDRIIIAGPGFSKEEFKKYATAKDPRLAKKFWLEHASSAEKTAVYELLKTGALEKAVSGQKLQEEFMALEALKRSLGRSDGLCVYGAAEVRSAISANAASDVLVSDTLLRSDRSLNRVLEQAQRLGAKVMVFNSEDDAGREFSAFQIAALLRYRLKF
ncbi:MAG: mRNA surveillance protein pelota [Candidatus Micrarchaeota archaeon]